MKLLVEKKEMQFFSVGIDRSDISMITVMRVSAISSMSCSRHQCQTSTDSGKTINFIR